MVHFIVLIFLGFIRGIPSATIFSTEYPKRKFIFILLTLMLKAFLRKLFLGVEKDVIGLFLVSVVKVFQLVITWSFPILWQRIASTRDTAGSWRSFMSSLTGDSFGSLSGWFFLDKRIHRISLLIKQKTKMERKPWMLGKKCKLPEKFKRPQKFLKNLNAEKNLRWTEKNTIVVQVAESKISLLQKYTEKFLKSGKF